MEQFYWLTLTIVYITAQSTTSLFNFGFIVNCFFFLWHGQSLYLRPKHTMRRWWKTFIGYNFFVILAKVWLQVSLHKDEFLWLFGQRQPKVRQRFSYASITLPKQHCCTSQLPQHFFMLECPPGMKLKLFDNSLERK